jgi:hypothetical protein
MARSYDNFVVKVDEELIQPRRLEIYENFRLLWIKVILRAAYDWVLYRDSKNQAYKRIADSADIWLFGDYMEKIRREVDGVVRIVLERPANSLHCLCEELDLDIETVRRFAKRLTKKDIRKLEFFTRNRKNVKKETRHIDDVFLLY